MMKKAFIAAIFMVLAAAPAALAEYRVEDIEWKAEAGRVFMLPPAIEKPAWAREAVPFTQDGRKPMIAIVIDDVGVDVARSQRAVESLPAEITLSYLPYAPNVRAQAERARADGHEIMVHMPMQPQRDTANPGPDYLGTEFTAKELRRRLLHNLAAFDGYVGINNHMGSKFTRDRAGMEIVMQELEKRGLLFLDSRTIGDTVAEEVAGEHGLLADHRDVFLDDSDTAAFVRKALRETESHARRHGTAIAIGHPRDITLAALEEWIPTLEQKGFQLAPVSAVMRARRDMGKTPHLARLDLRTAEIGRCETP